MQAIITKYIGPTAHRGARVQAKCAAKTVILSWDHGLGILENHSRAANELAQRLAWLEGRHIVMGGLPNASGYACVLVQK